MNPLIVFIVAIALAELCKYAWLVWSLLRAKEDDDAKVDQRQESPD